MLSARAVGARAASEFGEIVLAKTMLSDHMVPSPAPPAPFLLPPLPLTPEPHWPAGPRIRRGRTGRPSQARPAPRAARPAGDVLAYGLPGGRAAALTAGGGRHLATCDEPPEWQRAGARGREDGHSEF